MFLCAACGGWMALHVVLLWTGHRDLVCEQATRIGCLFAVALQRGMSVSHGLLLVPLGLLGAWAWHQWLRVALRAKPARPEGIASCAAVLGLLGLSGLGVGLWLAFGSYGFSRHGNDDAVTQVALLAGSIAMAVLAWGLWRLRRWARIGAVPALLWPVAAAVSLGGDSSGPLVLLFYALPFFGVALYLSAGPAYAR